MKILVILRSDQNFSGRTFGPTGRTPAVADHPRQHVCIYVYQTALSKYEPLFNDLEFSKKYNLYWRLIHLI